MILSVHRTEYRGNKVRYFVKGDVRDKLSRASLSGKGCSLVIFGRGVAHLKDLSETSFTLTAGNNTVIECPLSAVMKI